MPSPKANAIYFRVLLWHHHFWILYCLFHYKPPPNLVASNHNNIHLLTSLRFGFSLVKRLISILLGICWDWNPTVVCGASAGCLKRLGPGWASLFSPCSLFTGLAWLPPYTVVSWQSDVLHTCWHFFRVWKQRQPGLLSAWAWKPQNVTSIALFLSKGQALI